MVPSDPSCQTCMYFLTTYERDEKEHEDFGLGQCRRYPPKLVGSAELSEALSTLKEPEDAPLLTIWRHCHFTAVHWAQWCGEYVRKV